MTPEELMVLGIIIATIISLISIIIGWLLYRIKRRLKGGPPKDEPYGDDDEKRRRQIKPLTLRITLIKKCFKRD